jgi:hypothetical protein
MTQATLRAVTLKTIANYAQAAERAVDAYRVSGHRLISAVQRGVDQATTASADQMMPRVTKAVRKASQQASGLVGKGVDTVSRGTERVIERSTDTVSAQLERVADMAEGLDNKLVASTLQATVRVTMPGAQAALALSERVAAAVDMLPRAPAPKRETAARGARARKVAKEVEAPVEAVVKTVKKAAVKPAADMVKAVKAAAKPVVEAAKPVRARRAAKPAPMAATPETAAEAA